MSFDSNQILDGSNAIPLNDNAIRLNDNFFSLGTCDFPCFLQIYSAAPAARRAECEADCSLHQPSLLCNRFLLLLDPSPGLQSAGWDFT
jgi:hypothetical protein